MNLKNMDRRLFTILMIVFVQMLGSAMILPILPLYAKSEFDLSPRIITLLITSFFAAQFIASPFLGRLSDRRGRIPVLIISQIGTVISFLMLATAQSAEVLFLSRILDGITGGNIIVAQAYVTDITPKEKRTEALGYVFAVFGVGFVIGPALGGILAAAFGYRAPYLIACAAAAAVVLLTWFTLEETITPEKQQASRKPGRASLTPGEVMRNAPLLLIMSIAFLGQFGLGLLQSTFALYGEAVLFKGRDPRMITIGIGLLLAAFGMTQLLTQTVLLRRLLRRLGEYWLVILGNLSRMTGSFIYAVIVSPWPAIAGSIFFAFGVGIMMPSLQSLATRTVDDDFRGGVLGLYQSAISLSIIVSSAMAGDLFEIKATLPYWLGGLLAILALVPAVFLMILFGRSKPVGEKSPS